MKNKVIIPAGYMGSGSSAITDLISEIDGYDNKNGSFEYVFMHCPGGFFDLEDKLLIGNNALRSDEALHTFYYTMKNLYENKHYWVADYSNKMGIDFLYLIEDFLNKIIDNKFKDTYWYYQENPNTKVYIKKFINKILKLISAGKIISKPGKRYEEMWVSYVTSEDFYKESKLFLNNFFDEMGLIDNNIILDQFLLPHNLFRIDRYFDDNVKIIVVERDPRDIFLLNKYYWNMANCPVPYPFDVKEFCTYYRKMRNLENITSNKNILRIRFEDLVYNYEDEINKIYYFLSVDSHLHKRIRTNFIPEKSITNTQIFMKNNKFKSESDYIFKNLNEFIYDFPYYDESIITEANLIL